MKNIKLDLPIPNAIGASVVLFTMGLMAAWFLGC